MQRIVGLAFALVILSGCATRWNEPAPPSNTPSTSSEQRTASGELPKSRYGNPPVYEVFGKRYFVMNSSLGYEEQGIASWYGKKFHGRKTSSGEVYNMYAFTAAHKSLPLPTDVRVTNRRNGKSIVVRVNDRGPFVDGRIIDLSYAAARQLDMITDGTAPVDVVALNPKPRVSKLPDNSVVTPRSTDSKVAATETATKQNATQTKQMYLQVGAFSAAENAAQLVDKLTSSGIQNALVAPTTDSTAVLYRVRIGPLQGVAEYDATIAQIAPLGLRDLRLVFVAATESVSLTNSATAAALAGG